MHMYMLYVVKSVFAHHVQFMAFVLLRANFSSQTARVRCNGVPARCVVCSLGGRKGECRIYIALGPRALQGSEACSWLGFGLRGA